MTKKINIPAKMIVAKLIREGKTPIVAKRYTPDIVYSAIHGRIDDPQVLEAAKELQGQLCM